MKPLSAASLGSEGKSNQIFLAPVAHYDVFDEHRYFEPQYKLILFTFLDSIHIGVTICETYGTMKSFGSVAMRVNRFCAAQVVLI